MRAHIVADVHAAIPIIGDDALVHKMCSLSYPIVNADYGTDEEALSVLWPKDGMFETLLVDRSGQTLLWSGDRHIPERLRGSFPCFNLSLPPDTVVHGVFFRSSDCLENTDANSIKLALFDISQSEGENFAMLCPEMRQKRLLCLFGRAWHEEQNRALLRLCRRLQTMSDEAKRLGQSVMEERDETEEVWTWPVEFLDAFSRYEWRNGFYFRIVNGLSEMDSVIHPIPKHIQIFRGIPVKELKSIKDTVQYKLPGAPAFGGVLQLPLALTPDSVCKVEQM